MSGFDWSKAAEPDEKPKEAEPRNAKPKAEGFDWGNAAKPAPVRVSKEPGDLVDLAPEETEPEPEDPGLFRTIAHNFAQGGMKGGLDEAAGLWAEKMPRALGGQEPGIGESKNDVYRRYRGGLREQDKAGWKHHPGWAMGAQVAGDLASDYVLGTLGIPVGSPIYQTALGVVTGLLSSEAELTTDKTNPAELAKAGASAAMGGVGAYYLPKIGNRIAGKIANSGLAKTLVEKSRGAAADQAQKVAGAVLAKVREATGAMGGATSSARRSLEVLREVLTSPAATQEQKLAAKAFLESDEGVNLLRKTYDNTLERAPEEMARLGQAAATRESALKGATQEAIEEGTDAVLSKPMEPIKRALWKYGTRMLPIAAGSWVGNQLGGGTLGTAGGALAGGALGVVMGDPGTSIKNIVNNPAVRKGAAEALHKILVETPEQLGKRAPYLLRLVQRGGPEMALIANWLMNKGELPEPQSSEPEPEPQPP